MISSNLKEFGNRPIENITFDEVKKYLDEGSNLIREVSSSISIRKAGSSVASFKVSFSLGMGNNERQMESYICLFTLSQDDKPKRKKSG